jgi:mycothiol synthase
VHGGYAGFAGVVAHENGADAPIGYAQLSRHPASGQPHWELEIVVHPRHRSGPVGSDLGRAALGIVRSDGGGPVHLWIFKPTPRGDDLARDLGFEPARDLLHMRVPLPVDLTPEFPPGVRIRSFEPGRDERAWLELNNRAFDSHPEQGGWDAEMLARRMNRPWFDANDVLLAVDDSGLAGSNWTKLDHTTGVGEIYVIAVDPSRHRSGLGKALSIAGLVHMADRGMREGALYVDAANENAVHMYRSIGFEVDHLDRAYVTDVEAG